MKWLANLRRTRLIWAPYFLVCIVAATFMTGLDTQAYQQQTESAIYTHSDISADSRSQSYTSAGSSRRWVDKSRPLPARPSHSASGMKGEPAPTLARVIKFAALSIFFMMLFTPFVPGIIEYYWPKDDKRLPIDLNYVKDPRYFGIAFRAKMRNAIQSGDGVEQAQDKGAFSRAFKRLIDSVIQAGAKMFDGKISKKEKIEVSMSRTIAKGETLDHVLYVSGDLSVGSDAKLKNDVLVTGKAEVGTGCFVRALCSDGDLSLSRKVDVLRWIDAEGSILVGQKCDLGKSASCLGRLELGRNVTFKRLYAGCIQTQNGSPESKPMEPNRGIEKPVPNGFQDIKTIEDVLRLERGNLTVGTDEKVDGDLVVTGDLNAGNGVTFTGTLKVYGTATFGRGCKIAGSVFAEKRIRLGQGCFVGGNLFSQDAVIVGAGSCVGREKEIKSVIGKKKVTLHQGVKIYGFVESEGKGWVQ
jgi:predicted acyltransferase (DUF342 family)